MRPDDYIEKLAYGGEAMTATGICQKCGGKLDGSDDPILCPICLEGIPKQVEPFTIAKDDQGRVVIFLEGNGHFTRPVQIPTETARWMFKCLINALYYHNADDHVPVDNYSRQFTIENYNEDLDRLERAFRFMSIYLEDIALSMKTDNIAKVTHRRAESLRNIFLKIEEHKLFFNNAESVPMNVLPVNGL